MTKMMSKKRILVVEDEHALAEAIRIFLEMNGMAVQCASNGRDALTAISEGNIDLIVCDINLPDISGHDILRTAKSDFKTFNTPFIFLSAYSDEKDIRRGMNAGANDYLTKPFSSKELVKTINAHLEIESKRQDMIREQFNSKLLGLVNEKVATDILGPLDSIINATFLMESAGNGYDHMAFNDTLNAIYSTSFSMYRKARNLLICAELEQAAGDLMQPDNIFPSDLLNSVLEYYNNGLTNNYSRINADIGSFGQIRTNKKYLEILFTELIDNAVRYDSKKRCPAVALKRTVNGFEFSITNDLSEENHNVLNSFVQDPSGWLQAHHTRERIGLFICSKLCERLHYRFQATVADGLAKFTVSS